MSQANKIHWFINLLSDTLVINNYSWGILLSTWHKHKQIMGPGFMLLRLRRR